MLIVMGDYLVVLEGFGAHVGARPRKRLSIPAGPHEVGTTRRVSVGHLVGRDPAQGGRPQVQPDSLLVVTVV